MTNPEAETTEWERSQAADTSHLQAWLTAELVHGGINQITPPEGSVILAELPPNRKGPQLLEISLWFTRKNKPFKDLQIVESKAAFEANRIVAVRDNPNRLQHFLGRTKGALLGYYFVNTENSRAVAYNPQRHLWSVKPADTEKS